MDGDIFGQRLQTPLEEAWHNEQKRKQYDVIRVANPATVVLKGRAYTFSPEIFPVEYDTNQWQNIQPGVTTDIPHYIALRYVEHKKDDIVNKIVALMHQEQLADRDAKGLPRYTDKYTENKETYETNDYPKNNDPEVIDEIYDQLWVGVVYEFGKDRPPMEMNRNARSGEVDLTPASQKAFDALRNKRVPQDQNPMNQYVEHSRAPLAPQSVQTIPQQPSGFAALNKQLGEDN